MNGTTLVDRIELRGGGDERSERECLEQWEALLSETYVPLAFDPLPAPAFHGRVVSGRYGELSLSTIGSTPQIVTRTSGLLSAATDEYLLTTIQTRGQARLHQDGRVADVVPGSMVCYDSTREYRWEGTADWEMLVVQIPLSVLRARPDFSDDDIRTAVPLPQLGPTGVVSRFFRDLAEVQAENPEGAALLATPAVDLLAAVLRQTTDGRPAELARDALERQRVLDYMRRHCADPGLTVDRIADGCRMSRRSLYRVFDEFEDGPATVLRRMRVDHACDLLARYPNQPISMVAYSSGFLGERQFYRAFREERGVTPSLFRAGGAARLGD
ncbi:helix-turn-helix domain-containing protein [Nocardia yamanashiensis]|uniref:AraC-like ligand-binding domain-containing protein n=1 Tax=Nocardia yamanashiensis TaxID=209247 RepID=UPI000831F46F|nr:helix-turn-helix domain-containing protein [Nocardia yamanashiensis]